MINMNNLNSIAAIVEKNKHHIMDEHTLCDDAFGTIR